MIETVLRVILHRHFNGEILLVRLMNDGQSCLVEHADGMRGVVMKDSIIALELSK